NPAFDAIQMGGHLQQLGTDFQKLFIEQVLRRQRTRHFSSLAADQKAWLSVVFAKAGKKASGVTMGRRGGRSARGLAAAAPATAGSLKYGKRLPGMRNRPAGRSRQ